MIDGSAIGPVLTIYFIPLQQPQKKSTSTQLLFSKVQINFPIICFHLEKKILSVADA